MLGSGGPRHVPFGLQLGVLGKLTPQEVFQVSGHERLRHVAVRITPRRDYGLRLSSVPFSLSEWITLRRNSQP